MNQVFFRRDLHVGSYRLNNSDQIRHCNSRGEGHVCKESGTPVPRGGAPMRPNFGLPPIYAHILRRRTTIGVITHMEEGHVLWSATPS